MYIIHKKKEPRSLTKLRAKLGSRAKDPTHDVMKELDKETNEAVRQALLEEQHSVCCYCTCPISRDNLRVEHWDPQKLAPERRLEWRNLLGACSGNKGQPGQTHCDISKGSERIEIDPQSAKYDKALRYTNSGKMITDDPGLQKEVDEILCLNVEKLQRAREAALKAFLKDYQVKKENLKQVGYTRKHLERVENRINQHPAKPFQHIILSFLRRKSTKN